MAKKERKKQKQKKKIKIKLRIPGRNLFIIEPWSALSRTFHAPGEPRYPLGRRKTRRRQGGSSKSRRHPGIWDFHGGDEGVSVAVGKGSGLKEVRKRESASGSSGAGIMGAKRARGARVSGGESGDRQCAEKSLYRCKGRDIIGFWAFPELLKFEADRGQNENLPPPPLPGIALPSKNIKVSILWKGEGRGFFFPLFV